MSRIGKLPIEIPAKVELKTDGNNVQVKGPKGELTFGLNEGITVKTEGNEVTIERASDAKHHRALHGLTRAIISNMVEGVSKGFKVEQELVGVGYRANANGQMLDLVLGYS